MKNTYNDFPKDWKKNSQAALLLISEKSMECRVCKKPAISMESVQNPDGGEIFVCAKCAGKITGRY